MALVFPCFYPPYISNLLLGPPCCMSLSPLQGNSCHPLKSKHSKDFTSPCPCPHSSISGLLLQCQSVIPLFPICKAVVNHGRGTCGMTSVSMVQTILYSMQFRVGLLWSFLLMQLLMLPKAVVLPSLFLQELLYGKAWELCPALWKIHILAVLKPSGIFSALWFLLHYILHFPLEFPLWSPIKVICDNHRTIQWIKKWKMPHSSQPKWQQQMILIFTRLSSKLTNSYTPCNSITFISRIIRTSISLFINYLPKPN